MTTLYSVYFVDDEFVEAVKSLGIDVSPNGASRHPTYKEFVGVIEKVANCNFVHKDGMITLSNEPYHQYIYDDDNTIGDNQSFDFYLNGYCAEIMNPILQELSNLCGRLIVIKSSDFLPVFFTG